MFLFSIKLIGKERSYSPKLHNTLATIHDCNLVLTHKLFTTMSSDEFKMGNLFIMRRDIKCDIQKPDSQLLNNIA